jgi:subtilase family serine protease
MHARTLKLAVGIAAAAAVLAVGSGAAWAVSFHIVAPGRFAQQPTFAQCEEAFGVGCYSATQVRHAYGIDQLNAQGVSGRGQTIVLVDSYGSPSIQSDLRAFDEGNHLPAPPSLQILTPAGAPPAWNPTVVSEQTGWAGETTLDVEYAHAMAPGANIILLETPIAETEGVTGLPQMMYAEQYVIDHNLASVISQSFGATEQTFQNAQGRFDPSLIYGLRYAFEDAAAKGVTVLAATGDAGATDYEPNLTDLYPFRAVDWPASDPLVTAVGGTHLTLEAAGNRTAPDTVWNDLPSGCFAIEPCATNGGVSIAFSRPFFQNGVSNVVGYARGLPDIVMSGSCSGAVNIYESFPAAPGFPAVPGSWSPICGTSEASPLFSGEVAMADQLAGHPLGDINPLLYEMGDRGRSGITDITSGNNTVTWTQPTTGQRITVKGYEAGPGYDLASGLGTANAAFPLELAGLVTGRGWSSSG